MFNWQHLLGESGLAVFILIALGFWLFKKGIPGAQKWLEKQEERAHQQIKAAQDQVKEARGEVKQEREYMRIATAEFMKSLAARDDQFQRMAEEFRKLSEKAECRYPAASSHKAIPSSRKKK